MTICTGLRVVELGAGSTGASIAGMVLADAGARVVKVEPPDGDRLRTQLPSAWLVWNRGKESLVADLHTEEGREAVRDLARHADVVIDGLAPGTSDGWGVGADQLTTANPQLVHCAITGFGPRGPFAGLKGYEALVAAKVGLFGRGSYGFRPGPIMYSVPWGGFGAAMQSVAGILSALLVRDQTGRGQHIDATLLAGLEPLDYFVSPIIQLMARQGKEASSDARDSTSASRYGVVVATRDGRFIQTSTLLPHQGKALVQVAGLDHLIDEPRFKDMPMFANPDDAQAWEDLLWEAFRAEDLAYWLPRLEAATDVAFEVAATSEESLDHPQIVHNRDSITIEDPTVGPVRQVGALGHFSVTPIEPTRSAPGLGEHRGPFPAPDPQPPAEGGAPAYPLAGTTIVEFGYFYAMPYGVAMAASLGARVIKLEDTTGDPMRRSFGAEIGTFKTTAGKESLSVDLRTEEGRRVAQQVVASADVFVTGFRSGVADKLGLGYEELRQLNPRLLYMHAGGYGVDGPYAKRALYAQAAQAVGGSFGRQVAFWTDPANNLGMSVIELQAVVAPRLNQVVDGDSNAALAVLAALVLGIFHQRRTGEGQHVMTSMIGGNAWAYSDDFNSYEGKAAVPRCDSENFGTSALHRLYPATDGTWVCLAVGTSEEWTHLLEALGAPDLGRDGRFADAASRRDHDEELADALEAVFATRPAADWEADLTAAGVGCVEASLGGHAAFMATNPVIRQTGQVLEAEHPLFGVLWRSAPPLTFSETPMRVAPQCLRGQHNRSILHEAGYDDAAIDALEVAGAVIPPSPASGTA
jgi:crotonobetainyl-CoA:carnitine CoA-transferase CaiB-like acyl-CoA transferase